MTMRELVDKLNYHTELYDKGCPEISDKEWDDMYFELEKMEQEQAFSYPDSPTQRIYCVDSLKKVKHNHSMLSCAKTKDIEVIDNFIKDKTFAVMLKLDGLSCSLRYVNGKLVSAETRGNGEEGEDITHNALVIPSIPKYIDYFEELIIDGEILVTKKDFEKVKDSYINPRAAAVGGLRVLNAKDCSKVPLTFIAWNVVKGFDDIIDTPHWFSSRLLKLQDFKFITVPHIVYTYLCKDSASEIIDRVKNNLAYNLYPIDGYVFRYNDIIYGDSLGATAHHRRDMLAFKMYDEEYPTQLRSIDWTMGRTGVLTPVAVFDDVVIDGATINRANLHNLNILRDLLEEPYIGQVIYVFRSNMIIPQISDAEAAPKDMYVEYIEIPTKCPICGGEVYENESAELVCANPNCEGKLINKLDFYCSKKGLDIKGLSKATLEKLMDWGWVSCYADIYTLKEHRAEWVQKDGFGIKSVDKILVSIEKSRTTDLASFISAIGIPHIGPIMAKELCKYVDNWEDLLDKVADQFDFTQINGFSWAKHNSIINFNYHDAAEAARYLIFIDEIFKENPHLNSIKDKTFVITGRLNHFKNRDELVKDIQLHGGKVSTSVSSKTAYLINNDKASTSSKNKTAQQLNIPIISEEEYINLTLIK